MLSVKDYQTLANGAMRVWEEEVATNFSNQAIKKDGSKVSAVDMRISDLIKPWLESVGFNLDDCAILDEEKPDEHPAIGELIQKKYVVLFDPVDWTSNMLRGGGRFTLANLCVLERQGSTWKNFFSGTLRPQQKRIYCAFKNSKPAVFSVVPGMGWDMRAAQTFPPEMRHMQSIVLDTSLSKTHNWGGSDDLSTMYGASVDNMISMVGMNFGALMFHYCTWDMAFFPALENVGLRAHRLSNGRACSAFESENFWYPEKQKWGKAKDWIVFLPNLMEWDTAVPYIEKLRGYLSEK